MGESDPPATQEACLLSLIAPTSCEAIPVDRSVGRAQVASSEGDPSALDANLHALAQDALEGALRPGGSAQATTPEPPSQQTPAIVTAPPLPSPPAHAPVQQIVSAAIGVPVRDAQWGQDLGSRVLWMVNQHHQEADIRLNPPHLGPLEVRVAMQHDQASVTFASAHGAVREAIEAAVPRLRELLGQNGVQLAQVNITQQSFSEQRGKDRAPGSRSGGVSMGGSGQDEDVIASATGVTSRLLRGLVDYFA